MLRFNLCFRLRLHMFLKYFNTSYVTVQQFFREVYKCVCMDFNTSYVTVQPDTVVFILVLSTFQYILCYGSTFKDEAKAYFVLEFQYILCYGSTNAPKL